MSKNPIANDEALYDYLKSVSVRETTQLIQLRKQTASMPSSGMQISPDQGQFMAMLVHLIEAKHIIEIGTFTGYSTLCMALALPDDGRIIACDVSREWTTVGQVYWDQAGVQDKIDLRLGPALDTLDSLLSQGCQGTFDLAFIDADKANYDHYYEKCLQLIKPNKLILIDNVFWGGAVLDSQRDDEDTNSIRALNAKIATDPRIDRSMITIGDGLTLVRKKC